MGSGANTAISCRFRRFPFSGGQRRVVVALLAAIVFAVHLLSMHSAHHGDSGHAAELASEAAAPSASGVVRTDHGPVHQDHDGAHTDDLSGAIDSADVLTIDHPHGEVECGEITQSRLGVAASVLVPALGCLWVAPRPAGLIRSQGPTDLPRWTPHLVRELGVQRV